MASSIFYIPPKILPACVTGSILLGLLIIFYRQATINGTMKRFVGREICRKKDFSRVSNLISLANIEYKM